MYTVPGWRSRAERFDMAVLEAYEPIERRWQDRVNALDVAVDDVPRGAGPWERSPADSRVDRLLYVPILLRDDDDSMHGKTAGQLASEVTTTDLGRRVVLTLRTDARWSDGSRSVGSIDVGRTLTDAADPTSPRYSARWGDLLERVDAVDGLRDRESLGLQRLRDQPPELRLVLDDQHRPLIRSRHPRAP